MSDHAGWAHLIDAVTHVGPAGDLDAALRAVRLGLDVAAGVVSCSVTEVQGNDFSTPFATSSLALRLDEAQYDAGSGPCMSAAVTAEPVRIDDMGQDTRYLAFSSAAVRGGVGSSLSVPLVGGRQPAALNLYGASVNVFEPSRARGIAALLASCIAELLPRTVPTARSLQSHDGRRVAAARPAALIHRAEAAVSVSEHLSTQAAFSRLAQRSRDQNRSIFDVAHDAVGGPDRARSAGLAAP